MPVAEEDYVDDLELLEEYDYLASDSDASTSQFHTGSGQRHDDDDAEDQDLDDEERLEQLKIPILSICSALGGYEEELDQHGHIRTVYKLGDDCLACLRDLRRLWKQDDTDPSRAIARVFAQVNVLHNDLVPILLCTAGKGGKSDKVALACTDLLTAMTWPVDAMSEIHDAVTKDESTSLVVHLPELEKAQTQYKSSVLRLRAADMDPDRDVLSVVLRHILLPAISKPRMDRTERDAGVVGMCLHLFRNLLTIRDPIATTLSSTDVLAQANLQSSLICAMSKAHILDTLLMLASSADTRDFNQWNAVTCECIYQVFVGTDIKELVDPNAKGRDSSSPAEEQDRDHAKRLSSSALSSVLAAEAKEKRAAILSHGSTRHSRFGTTINFVGHDGHRRVARSQSALKKSVAQLTEENLLKAKRRARRRKPAREFGAPKLKASWTPQAAALLQAWADRFMETGFETLSRSVLQDIRSEREKMGDLDLARIRIMQLGSFFLEYFLLRKTSGELQRPSQPRRSSKGKERAVDDDDGQGVGSTHPSENAGASTEQQSCPGAEEAWPFAYVAGWLEPWSFKMVLVRSVEAQDNRNWLEFVAAVQLWTILLRLVDKMSRSQKEEDREIADGLQAQLYYLGETLDACQTIVRSYTTQSFACLDTIMTFAYILPKMLERYSSNREHMYVRARKQVRKSRQNGELDGQEDEAAQVREQAKDAIEEREFKFNGFQKRLSTRQLAGACVMYLLRWREFSDPEEQLGKVVAIMHRIAIKASDYRQFFVGITPQSFRSILTGPAMATLERKAPASAKDLRKFMDYILRKYTKLDPEERALYDSGKSLPKPAKEIKVPVEIKVRDSRSYNEQIGIAVGLLLRKEKMEAVLWVKSGLEMASAQRTEILLSVEAAEQRRKEAQLEDDEVENPGGEDAEGSVALGDSNETAADKIQDYELMYEGKEEVRLDASILPELKLLCRLVGLESNEDETLHWRWTVPARLLPAQLDERISTIEDYIRTPYQPEDGVDLSKLVQRKLKPRATVPAGVVPHALEANADSDDSDSDSDSSLHVDGTRQGKAKRRRPLPADPKTRRAPRQKKWTGENFIEDSDEEFAFAMALGGGAASAASDHGGGHDSDEESDARMSGREGSAGTRDTPPTSSLPGEEGSEGEGVDDEDEDEDDEHVTASFTQRKRQKKQSSLDELRERRRKALFLGFESDRDDDGDHDDHDGDEEEAVDLPSSARPLLTDGEDERYDSADADGTAPSPPGKRTRPVGTDEWDDADVDRELDSILARREARSGVLEPSSVGNVPSDGGVQRGEVRDSSQTVAKRRRVVVDSEEEE